MKVLLSAYACEPYRGSEPEVGLQAMLAAASKHEVWVLTRRNNVAALQGFLEGHDLQGHIHIEGLDLGARARAVKRRGLLGLHWYYDRWQRLAGVRAAELNARIGFDVVHHVTFASYWTRAGAAIEGKPFVWGPVGGGVSPLLRLAPDLGLWGTIEDVGRIVLRQVNEARPVVRKLQSAASVTFSQNEETRSRLPRASRVVMLPNASAVEVSGSDSARARNASIVFAGRLVPWKGARLAVRTLRHVAHTDAKLHIFGDGPDRKRIESAARAWGIRDRVEFMRKVGREQFMEALASSGVLLHPAMHDECPLTIAEALSLGTPVVALAHGGPVTLSRVWAESPTTLIQPGGVEATARRLAEAVDRVLANPPSPPVQPHRPGIDFASSILAAYDEATLDHPPAIAHKFVR